MSDPFATDDAAYVLGALDPRERDAFEAHLPGCAACRARVAELRPVVGLLGGLTVEHFQAAEQPADADAGVPHTPHPALRRTAGRPRRRRTLVAVLGAAAAALAVAGAVALGVPGGAGHAQPRQALTAVASSPVRASVQLTDTSWGTQVRLWCDYGTRYGTGADYALVLTDRHGHAYPAGSWRLSPGTVTTFTSGTALSRAQIARVTITLPGGEPILVLSR